MPNISGGCACGVVKYVVNKDPTFSFHCQCRQCQRASGTGHASQFVVRKEALTLAGKVRYFDQIVDDGSTTSRGFCPICGSPIISKNSSYPDIRMIQAGSLEEPGEFKPEKVIWSESSQGWDYIDPELPRE